MSKPKSLKNWPLFGTPGRTGLRNARTQRICVAFPNQLAIGQDGQAAPDPWESFLMFLKYCLQCTGYLIERGTHATIWLNHYDNLMQQLSTVRSILPRVKISAAGQSYENLMEFIFVEV